MQFIANLFTTILQKITAVASWLLAVVGNMFKALWLVVTDLFCWGFEAALSVVTAALASLDLSGLTGHMQAFGEIPADVVNILSLLGVGQAIGIVVSALVIRFVLQLIPFVRLGS